MSGEDKHQTVIFKCHHGRRLERLHMFTHCLCLFFRVLQSLKTFVGEGKKGGRIKRSVGSNIGSVRACKEAHLA
eukprot:2780295-Amphidinium_carterae.1